MILGVKAVTPDSIRISYKIAQFSLFNSSSLRDPTLSFVEPSTRPYNLRTRRPHYSGNASGYNATPLAAPPSAYNTSYGPGYIPPYNATPVPYNANRSVWGQEESLTSYNNAMGQYTLDILTLHTAHYVLTFTPCPSTKPSLLFKLPLQCNFKVR